MKFTYFAAALALPLAASAMALPGGGSSQCDVGSVQCCNSVQSSSSSPVAALLGLLGASVTGTNVPIGLTCNPISVIGAGSNACNANPVCCENNNFNGVIAIGCTPININA